MRINDEVTTEHIEFIESQLVISEVRIEELEEEIKSLRLELQLMFSDRCYVA